MTTGQQGRPSPRAWALLIGGIGVLSACWTTVRPTAPTPMPIAPAEPDPVPAPVASVSVDADGSTPAPPAPSSSVAVGDLPIPRIELSEMSGPGATNLNPGYFPRVRQNLESCGAKEGDVIEVALITQDGDIATSLRDSNTDPVVGACVVNRIAMDLDYYLSPSQSPSERLENVQSVLTIRW